MKTNHRRNFVAITCTDNAMWHGTIQDKQLGISVTVGISNDFSNGHRGMAKAKRGAKKYLHSRMRFKQKQYLTLWED